MVLSKKAFKNRQSLRLVLSASGSTLGPITLHGDRIGGFITHQHRQTEATVYASRIYQPVRILVIGDSIEQMLDKVADSLFAYLEQHSRSARPVE